MDNQKPHYGVALTAALGLFMAILDTTIVNVALVPMAKAFNTDLNTIEWVITGYFLSQAAVIPVTGYLSNRFGSRRVFMISLAFFTFGSLLCALSPNETLLITFRVIQGLGAGALFPLGQAIAFGAFPPEKRASAAPIVGIPVLLAPAFGPTIGGLILDNWSWEYLFYINVPVGIIALLLAWWIIPADKAAEREARTRFDYVGLTLSMLGILAVVYSFTIVSERNPDTVTPLNPMGDIYGWGYWLVWTLMGVGLVLLVGFALYELKVSKDPVVDLGLFKDYNFLISSIVSWFTAIVIFSSLLLLPVFLLQVRVPHLSALDAGLALMPQGIAAAFGVAFGGRFYSKLGVRILVLMAAVLLLGSSWGLMNFTTTTDGLALMPWLILRGLAFGLMMLPVQTLAMQTLSGAALAKASSLFNMTRQIAQSVGTAVVLTLFVQQTTSHATELQAQALKALPAGTVLNPNSPQVQAMREQLFAKAGTSSINDVFTILTFGTVILFLLALALPSRQKQAAMLEASGSEHHEPVMMME